MLAPMEVCKHGVKTPFTLKLGIDPETGETNEIPVCWGCIYDKLMDMVKSLGSQVEGFSLTGRISNWMDVNTRFAVYIGGSKSYDFFIQYVGTKSFDNDEYDWFLYIFRDVFFNTYKFDMLRVGIDEPQQLDMVMLRARDFLRKVLEEAEKEEQDDDSDQK